MGKSKKVEGQVPDLGGAQDVRAKTKGKKHDRRANKRKVAEINKADRKKANRHTHKGKDARHKHKGTWLLCKNNGNCHCTQNVKKGDHVVATYNSKTGCNSHVGTCNKTGHRKAGRKVARKHHRKAARMKHK